MTEVLSDMMSIPPEAIPMETSGPQLYVVSNELGSHGGARRLPP